MKYTLSALSHCCNNWKNTLALGKKRFGVHTAKDCFYPKHLTKEEQKQSVNHVGIMLKCLNNILMAFQGFKCFLTTSPLQILIIEMCLRDKCVFSRLEIQESTDVLLKVRQVLRKEQYL